MSGMLDVLRAGKRWLRRYGGFIGSVTAVRTSQSQIVLTYDDGPEPGGTDQILSVLADHGATATFFVLMTRVRRYPGLLDEVVAAGHEIGLHGLDHRPLTGLSFAEARRRIRDGKAELEDAIGAPVNWTRPPYGRQTLLTWRAITSSGLDSVMWGPSTRDSIDRRPSGCAARCAGRPRAASSSPMTVTPGRWTESTTVRHHPSAEPI
jgi:peptidoglycan/xylan/chitin deacetylase (PgdA/CDA1 family)